MDTYPKSEISVKEEDAIDLPADCFFDSWGLSTSHSKSEPGWNLEQDEPKQEASSSPVTYMGRGTPKILVKEEEPLDLPADHFDEIHDPSTRQMEKSEAGWESDQDDPKPEATSFPGTFKEPTNNSHVLVKEEPLDLPADRFVEVYEPSTSQMKSQAGIVLGIRTSAHSGEKPLHCEFCNKNFTQRGRLIIHTRIHTGEKPYKCEICEKSFSHSASLKNHTRIHTGDRPYKCEICEKSFNQSCSLKKHTRIHTGEKPYKCEFCEKSFTQSGSLKKHTRIHTGEKPYKCEICEKSFSHSESLKKHTRIHTGDRPYKCESREECSIEIGNLNKHKTATNASSQIAI